MRSSTCLPHSAAAMPVLGTRAVFEPRSMKASASRVERAGCGALRLIRLHGEQADGACACGGWLWLDHHSLLQLP